VKASKLSPLTLKTALGQVAEAVKATYRSRNKFF